MANLTSYTEENIRSLDWREHIRMRPGMYIGKLGDGSSPDDGIYILLKEILDNCVDEYVMGAGKAIEISIKIRHCHNYACCEFAWCLFSSHFCLLRHAFVATSCFQLRALSFVFLTVCCHFVCLALCS